MDKIVFVSLLAVGTYLFLAWGFRSLTREEWQIALAAPTARLTPGTWRGTNYTYYGVFQACAFVASAVLLIVLFASMDLKAPAWLSVLFTGALAVISFSGSKAVARIVERRKHTFTVAGAFFTGFIASPWLILLIDRVSGYSLPVMPILAAGTASYAIGEGLGRLACISFGCCYGKPVSHVHPLLRTALRGRAFVFSGKTRKIAYEAGLDGTEVVPIQAITAVFLVTAGLAGVSLFLAGSYGAAFLTSAIGSQAWRLVSEALRADYRGKGRISAYQVMAVLSIVYACALHAGFTQPVSVVTDVTKGIAALWDPGMLLALQALGIGVFLFTGRSRVTESSLTFHVREDRA